MWQFLHFLLLLVIPSEGVVNLLVDLDTPRGIALDLEGGRMYWAEDGTQRIRSATLEGENLKDVIVKTAVQEAPRDVAIDSKHQKIYWTALCCGLRRADLDGKNEEVVASAEFASGVAVLDDYVYWADWMHGHILRSHVESGTEKAIVTGLASPVDVALDKKRQQIYWSDVGVGRAFLEGGEVQFLNMSWAFVNAFGMAVHSDLGKLYMADFAHTGRFTGRGTDYSGRIIRTNLDGSEAEVLVSEPGMSMPYGVAVDVEANRVYWTDRKLGRIQRLTLVCHSGVKEVESRTNSTVVKVPHGEVLHGSSTTVSCPRGYNGTVTFACNDNILTLNSGKCGERCSAGTYLLDHSALNYPDMDDREDLTIECPTPLAGAVKLRCQDAAVFIHDNQCRTARKCPARQVLLGHALVEHPAMDHGDENQSACPAGFEGRYSWRCDDGFFVAASDESCRAMCDSAGSLWVDGGRVKVSHSKIIEGGKVLVVCPAGSAGQGVYLSCEGGYINVTESTCEGSSFCEAGFITSGGANVYHGSLDDLEQIVLACPEGFSGALDLSCHRGEVTVLYGSQCHQSCAKGVTTLGSLKIPHPTLQHGDLVVLTCPDGHTGPLPFVCVEGNMTCAQCTCTPSDQLAGGDSDGTALSPSSYLPIAAFAAGVTAVVLLLLFTMRCSKRKKAMQQAEPVEQGVALPADFPGSWLMEWPDGQQVLTSISAGGRFEVERQTYDLTYLQQTPARLRCQGQTLELIRCTENVWIWRASQSEKTFCWMRIRPVAHSLSMDFSKESVTFVCTSCQRPIEEACFWIYRPCESKESYLCRDCFGDSDELQSKSHVRGISARYLLDIFPDLARSGTEKADPNFYEIAPVLAMGRSGLGFQKVCPRDGQPGCSIVDAVDPCYQGLVTHFVSWCWAYKLNDFVSAIAVWAQKEEQNIDCIFLWICFFCNNQYRILESKCQTGSEQLRSVFEGHLAQAGQMLLMLDTFVKPSYMTRAWCIFEAFVCIDKDFPMTIILPERAEAAFIENLDMSGGFTLLKTAFETMDVRRARASSTADEDMIKKLVFTTSGFDVVNKAVKRRLLSWLTDQFQNYVDYVAAPAQPINSQRSEGS